MIDQVPQEQVIEDYDRSETLERLRQLRKKIRPYFAMLDRVPQSELEKVVTSEDSMPFPEWTRSNSTITEMEEFLQQLATAHERNRAETMNEMDRMLLDYSELKEGEDLTLLYSINYPDVRKALKSMTQALFARKAEKEVRMEIIAQSITSIRAELSAVWSACHVYDEDKAHFMSKFNSKNFTDDLYEAHHAELAVWKCYQNKNRALMDKLARRQQMWTEMLEMEVKADDPSRFVNRGATLLKDQNALASIRKNLPKVEEELLRLATKFSIDHGRAFKIHGKEIATLIEEDWAKFKGEKGKKKFERHPSASTNGDGPQAQAAPVVPKTPRKRQATHLAKTPIPCKK